MRPILPSRQWSVCLSPLVRVPIRRLGRISLLILGSHAVASALEDHLYSALVFFDQHVDLWTKQFFRGLELKEILTPKASIQGTQKAHQFIDHTDIEHTAWFLGVTTETALLLTLGPFAWWNPTKKIAPSSPPQNKLVSLDTLRAGFTVGSVLFICLNAFLVLLGFLYSILFRIFDGVGANLNWSNNLAFLGGVVAAALVVGNIAPRLCRGTRQLTQEHLHLPSIRSESVARPTLLRPQSWQYLLSSYRPHRSALTIIALVFPLCFLTFLKNLRQAINLAGGMQ